MRLIAATVLLAFAALVATAKLAEPQTIPFVQTCRLIEPMIERVVAGAGGDAVRRIDFSGAEARRLIQRINAEPPESTFVGTRLVLIERDGYPSLIGISDESGCFVGGVQLSRDAAERIFGDRS